MEFRIAILPLRPMDKAKSDQIRDLCSRINAEQDRHKFLELIQQLNRLLSEEEFEGSEEADK